MDTPVLGYFYSRTITGTICPGLNATSLPSLSDSSLRTEHTNDFYIA